MVHVLARVLIPVQKIFRWIFVKGQQHCQVASGPCPSVNSNPLSAQVKEGSGVLIMYDIGHAWRTITRVVGFLGNLGYRFRSDSIISIVNTIRRASLDQDTRYSHYGTDVVK